MSGKRGFRGTHLDRRNFLLSGAAIAAGASLGVPRASAAPGQPRPAPQPIPGGAPIGLPAPYDFIHWFGPGPDGQVLPFTGVPLEGLNVEPSTITDFSGVTALAYLIGEARGSDGNEYDLEADIRVMDGRYVAIDGTMTEGTFALV